MMDLNDRAFVNLFREVCQKCLGHPVTEPLSETDSKLLVNNIFEQTGLVIGVKSIKNYSQYIFGKGAGKKENPSIATLDTLARFILNAPYTDEVQRKKNESHYPYWFQYKNGFSNTTSKNKKSVNWKKIVIAASIVLSLVIAVVMLRDALQLNNEMHLTEDFNSVNDDSLAIKGWVVKNPDIAYWNRRDENAGYLSLYTLKGDNWPDAKHAPGIKNLVIRRINSDCFTTEIHLTEFIPKQNWQQAGILLSEDSTFTGKALRLSISYNNFFGGYDKPAEIIIQVVGSSENGNLSKPEEIAHIPLFSSEPGKERLIADNLFKSALKIEKKDNHYRFLYTNGRMENFAFKEAARGDYTIRPKYIGLFAMQGFADIETPIPVLFDSFIFSDIDCGR